ncbi:uncharacterized protein LOC113227343 [Hyposmocoma kahamanoa]|uniref:uncharacterized protein LOC113227343 n=1 Tax=Hyposmocoma kahamanoa TaxID=1477025 RepID=UPI000E6D8BCD|nr:uncharacterized protein LOC113227343 [Hyposmocoma kahamanoa]
MIWCVIILCLCFTGAVYGSGNSLKDPYICGPPSCTPTEKFKYLPDVIYNYDYKVNIETYFNGSSNNRSTLDISAQVSMQFVTPCEGLLQLKDVKLIDQDENYAVERAEKFIHAVSLFDLRFAFHDGIISEVCPNELEEDWVLNFKRAILALFQNSMKRFDINFKGIEQDIHGSCKVDYTVRGQENTSLILMKSRDLSLCTNRYKYMSILQTVRYDFQSKFQTWPVLKSESKCRIAVDHHIYKSVNCRERHLFEPFSNRNSGGLSTVIQNLKLISETNKTDSEILDSQPKTWTMINRRANLIHHHTPSVRGDSGELKSARDVLKMLCAEKHNTDDDALPTTVDENMDSGSTVGLWGRLVRAARPLHYPALAQLLTRAPTICEGATKHIMDALPYIASAGSVELIKEKILENKVDKDTRHEWLMSMAMIPRPKIDMLKSMLELLQKQRYDKVISFTVSSMVHSYCKHSGKQLRECCEEEIPMSILVEFQNIVNEVVGKGIPNTDRTDQNNLVIAIKALGNIGGFKQDFADVLMNIVGDAFVPVPIRLTAIDAFRRTPCLETREYFLETFREHYVNIEIRLASYLQVMRCPNLSIMRKIFHALRNEPVNQAATFVWSHLNNLGQSSLPSRVEIQGMLSGHTMPQLEDSPDFRTFSRNYEQSVFFDQYNAGGNYEANVIFSPDSYIPRSVSLNLTVDMFGESINLLELKARGEGFERYFESIFGKDGPLSKSKINDQINNIRFLRSLNNADEAKRKIDDLGYKNEALKHQYPMAEIAIKVFGNEISFWSAEGDDEIRKSLERLNPQLWMLKILSGKEISYNKASLFLDTTFSVPTGSGFPLSLNLMGTSYINTKMSGNVVHKFRESKNLDFEGQIRPSVAINIVATMAVTAGGLSSSGIRLNTRLYTATGVEAKLSVRGFNLVRLDLSLPTQKQEIFAAKSELIILHGDQELQQQGLNKNRIEQNTCSWSTFDKAIGIKVCAAYQFPNMTNIMNAPYFLMSGPAKYIVSLEKADPSAKIYSFLYKSDSNESTTEVGFSFDTPNSKEKRMFNANIILSNTTSTAKVSFQSAESTMEAKALYRNQPYDKSLEASLDVNGRKQFDTLMSIKRHDIKYGYVWVPLAYWVVNDVKVAELSGTLQVKSKGGITQCDIHADFQTKQLASRLFGYYTINGPTHGTKLQLDYQFYKNPRQTVKLEGVCSKRNAGFRSDLYADLSMDFTAYPVYNFYAIFRNMKTQNHIDIRFNVSSSRELKENPAFSFDFIRVDKLVGVKLDTRLTVARPRPVKMQFSFEEIGPKYSVLAELSFNPKSRKIEVSGTLFYPPGTQLYLDAELNMTLPTLYPCTLKAKVHEKQPKEFQVNAVGVWFTGVDFNIDALYQDQSKTNMASHRLKLLMNSKHFKDIAVDARFTQDNRQITFIGQGEYNDDKYRTLMRYILLSTQNFTAYAELDVNGKAYSVNLNADLNNNTNFNMDVHFDQLRDLHLSYQRWATPKQKRLAAAFNWDANRDPSQKVSIDIQLDNKGTWHHGGYVTFYYPGRLVNGDFEFLLRDWFCQWHVRTSWSNEANILWRVKMYSEVNNETVYALISSLKTPFGGWQDTSFNVIWRYHDNLQAINGSMNWQEDYLAFSLLGDYLFKANEFSGEISAIINSTIPTLPRAAAIAKHKQIWKKEAETLLSFQYNEDGLLMIKSSWKLDKGEKENNVTGTVKLITPFKDYRNGQLDTKFRLGHKRDLYGVTLLQLEKKIVNIYVTGHMRRITNCMLTVNVTSPMALDLGQTTARFGFVESDRHLVAMVVTPNSVTGIEVLLKLYSLQDFHIFGHVALPIQYLNRAMVTAKRATEEVDFRVGWGTMDFGFTGIWQWRSPINFVYLYKLYTPLEGFEENGLVLKNVYGPGLDTELSIRLSKHKFGIAILLKDNGKGLVEVLQEKFKHKTELHDTLIDNFDTTGRVVLDTLYYPSITFNAHLTKFVGVDEEDILEVNATLHLPNQPPIVLTDIFVLETYTIMQNTLTLVTPFPSIKELKSVYTVDIELGAKFNITCTTLLYNSTYWHEISYRVFYEYECGEDDTYQSYLASLGIVTPLPVLPALDAQVSARLEDALWKMSADISMPSFTVAARGRLELDDPFVETSGSLNLTSPYLDDYYIKMMFKKDFSDAENLIGGGIQVEQGEHNNYLFADVTWRPPPNRYMFFKARGALVPVLSPSDVSILYNQDDEHKTLTVDLNSENNTYSLKADQRQSSFSAALSTPLEKYRAMKIISEFEGDNIRGSFVTDSIEYGITGKVLSREPLHISLTLVPKGKGEPSTMTIKFENSPTLYGLSAHLAGPVQATVRAKAEFQNNFTDINFNVDIPRSKYKEIYFKSRVDIYPDLRRVVTVQAATPLKRLQFVKGDTDFVFGPKTGYLLCKYELPDMKGDGDLKWSFLLGDLYIKDAKQATVFHLYDATKFNVTGKLDVYTYNIGKNLKLTAIHGNRTWTFDNNYETVDHELKQGSKVTWAEDVWLKYNIHVTNLTTSDETESQQLIMNVWYPLRTFNLVALYHLQDSLLDGKATLSWNVKDENKTAELNGRWESPPQTEGSLHFVDLSLSHPSFKKDVTLKGQYTSTPAIMSNITMELQYSDYENEYLKLKSILTDNSNGPIRDYKFALKCTHPSTNLNLDMKSDINIHSRWYYLNNYYRFQKTLFYEKLRHNKLLVDMNKSAVQYERANETYFYRANGTWDLTYPNYRVLAWVLRPTGNDTGIATLSMKDRSFIAHYNSTDDISYHMVGRIGDTRSAKLDAWRNFDEITTVDLASYIRLNHSRLLTSSIIWRPQIFSQVKGQAIYTLKLLYSQINDTLVILKEAPMEAHSALKNIWSDAKPRIRDFLDDLNDLHVIKDDLDDFELFLNESYNNNDFYVKDVVEFTYYVLDEMAIRNHLENLPGIINDMWGMMGNTSQSIKQSLTFVVDSVKMAYANFLDSMNKILEADFMELVSDKLEAIILQYDNFVRDLHIKFLKFWEETWVNATTRFAKYWQELLKSIEPLFFKILHYTESIVVTLWKGVMDFFYDRTQELTDNPYFNYVSTFGHEMDKIYKDLVNNDVLTNIRQYSKKLWNVVWNKIEQYIPFKDEVLQLYAEFRNAWENFLKNEQVVYVKEKCKEAYVRLKWWYDYFKIGESLDQAGEIIYDKITDMAKTALQYEEIHRTPKTNFIFDPRKGEILLEQKLPMSWHAFNRTPDFTEIAEYRAVRDFFDNWLTTNHNIWHYYYEIRPYMDINNVLPPFAGMAVMTGQGTLVTFDKRVFTVSEEGTFVLSKDYRQNNFTVLMESNDQSRYNLLVLTRRNLIHIDLYKEQVSIGSSPLPLPAVIDGLILDRQTDTITVQGQNGMDIQCNLLFRTCKLQVTGWYYATLGGLLGTYNNEQYDDFQLSNNTYTTSVAELSLSWNIEPNDKPPVENHELKNDTQCDKFFQNKVSPLHPCFSIIDAAPFFLECVAGVDACALASAYLELCNMQHVPVHIPDHCVQCTTPQGDIIEEGSFYDLQYVPNSTDVVFIIEAQYCNKNMRKIKNLDLFIEAFDAKLQGGGLADNRYAIVGFGGRGVYSKPRALYVNNKVFTNAIEISQHFDNFHIEKADLVRGNRTAKADMFSALSFATALPFRAGVPRTLVLFPCTRCDSSFMRLDYSTIHHNLVENSVTLHIIMDDDFMLSKKRVVKYLFGIDSMLAYTNKDYERLVGDASLRKQVKLPKEKLSVCSSLAMETNGTIFAGSKLSGDRTTARRFATVAGARAAQTARACAAPPRCECRDARLHCRVCADPDRMMELAFWTPDDIEDLIDIAMDPPTLPSFR